LIRPQCKLKDRTFRSRAGRTESSAKTERLRFVTGQSYLPMTAKLCAGSKEGRAEP
jgi:hypothetical protein